ncbi:MAG: transglycosylase SLT domain-containing protein [Minwuia sp.]|uniref:transglycosylase SLT domain-containing protein n=1 Tax=Minwuia sp. TaxID=2493630 RepID=UPI003A86B384
MRIISAIAVAVFIMAATAAEARTSADKEATARSCRDAVTEAERRYRIPAGLLQAIALVESGRTISGNPAKTAWPWTIHSEGTGRWLDSRGQAVEMVEDLQARGVTNIDVGCMQVNLMYHPDAFADLKSAFTPSVNADYAGRFLSELFQETKSWTRAASYYHSRTPEHATRYRKLVIAAWNGGAAGVRQAVRADVRAKLGRNTSAAGKLRRLGSSVYINNGSSTVRIRRY